MRLVVQGLLVQPRQLQHLAQLCGNQAQDFRQIATHAYYLPDIAKINTEIEAYCASQQLDCAFVADHHTLDNFGLVLMDMDSTLITIECIDEIADMHGLKLQVAAVTQAAMRGEIEFAESLRLRVALLKGLDESALQRVYDERLRLSPGTEQWIAACKQHAVRTMVVSGGFDFFVERVKTLAGLDYAQANRLEIVNGELTGKVLGDIVDAQAKADWLRKQRQALGLEAAQVIAIGDGANDLIMMADAGVSIAYHAKPIVQEHATYALNYVGLDGAANLFSLNPY
ncbi:MAG TPA: phosphoserine phosphatase SerB [Methylophilaceae bacterium]|nr:phosphoserine phosphatase SerB [Methylophilaceae bacterium]